jgi:D-alanyl-D-alanine carboxypeptidase/D-alanyl-D-alanine-endopeptidase (penicillin-binding protein 4)
VGWSWDDYNDDYMAERSPLPLSGNTIKIIVKNRLFTNKRFDRLDWDVHPAYFASYIPRFYALPLKMMVRKEMDDTANLKAALSKFRVQRKISSNAMDILPGNPVFDRTEIPFYTDGNTTAIDVLHDDYGIQNVKAGQLFDNSLYSDIPEHLRIHTIHTQPTDTLLKIMMHRSDNFYAEQSLLMVGNERIGVMNDEKIIDTLLATDYAGMPQRPQWVDGSGLSRFDLFTPQDFVFILAKMRNEFSWGRITTIFSTGGDGTLGSYYKNLRGKIFAKTGSLTNDIALSGYLITQKNKTLIFSVLVNNHTTSATAVRRVVERFLTAVQRDN